MNDNNEMQIAGVIVLVGLSIILFEVHPEKSVWSVPVRQADEHIVPGSGGFSLLLMQKQEAYKTSFRLLLQIWNGLLTISHHIIHMPVFYINRNMIVDML